MEAANAAQNRKHSLGPVSRHVRSSRHFFFLEMLFVTGPFRGREVDTWHKLTSLFWMSGTHLFIPSSRLDLLEHESMSVEKKKKKATTQ